MGRSETDRSPIVLELKFDGKAAVAGTITGPPSPGVIKTGTFDPKTGALKLEIVVHDSGGTVALFEGMVVQATAVGRLTLNNQTGDFIMTKSAGPSMAAQPSGTNEAAETLRKSFGNVSAWMLKAADLVPADKYTYQPAKTVRTFGQLIAHVADGYNYFCGRAAGQNVQWKDATEKGATDKATLVQKLKQSTDTCHAAYGGTGRVSELITNVGHTNLHYGNVITYMRMLGLVPPSS